MPLHARLLKLCDLGIWQETQQDLKIHLLLIYFSKFWLGYIYQVFLCGQICTLRCCRKAMAGNSAMISDWKSGMSASKLNS